MRNPSEAELKDLVHRVVNRTLAGAGNAAPSGAPSPIAPAIPSPPAPSAPPGKTIALGADHGGFNLKEMLKKHLEGKGFNVVDCGTHSTQSVDYPDFARAVAQLVSQDKAWRGIMIDGAGIGSCMVANKLPGVRASMCYDHATAHNAREHNDANLLTLGAGLIGSSLARQIVDIWLATPFAGGRHARRVDKIKALDPK